MPSWVRCFRGERFDIKVLHFRVWLCGHLYCWFPSILIAQSPGLIDLRRQPGTLFTQWQSVRFASSSVLGLFCLAAALLSLLYTTAAGALGKRVASGRLNTYSRLVQPQLRLPPEQKQTLVGEVRSQLYNMSDSDKACFREWPELPEVDPDYGAAACASFKTLSSCGSNLDGYLSEWGQYSLANKNASLDLDSYRRPRISASLNGNISVLTSWFAPKDIRSLSEKHGRDGT